MTTLFVLCRISLVDRFNLYVDRFEPEQLRVAVPEIRSLEDASSPVRRRLPSIEHCTGLHTFNSVRPGWQAESLRTHNSSTQGRLEPRKGNTTRRRWKSWPDTAAFQPLARRALTGESVRRARCTTKQASRCAKQILMPHAHQHSHFFCSAAAAVGYSFVSLFYAGF